MTVLFDKLADQVQDFLSSCSSTWSALSSIHDFLDLVETLSVTLFDKTGSGLVHLSKHLLVVFKLLGGCNHSALLRVNRCLFVGNFSSIFFLLGFDLINDRKVVV